MVSCSARPLKFDVFARFLQDGLAHDLRSFMKMPLQTA